MRWTGRLESNRMGGVLRTLRVQPKNIGSAKILVMQFDTIPRGRNHRRRTPAHGAATRPAHVGLLGNPAGKNLTASFCKGERYYETELGTSIDTARVHLVPTLFLRSDTSSAISGGAVV